MIVPMVALGGLPGREEDRARPTRARFPVTTPLFVVLLVGVILIVGALTFFPVLSLGPIVEHLLMPTGGSSDMAVTKRAALRSARSCGERIAGRVRQARTRGTWCGIR